MRRSSGSKIAMVLVAGVLALGALACSSDSSDNAATTTTPATRTCEAWTDVQTAFAEYSKVDIVNQGLDSVRTYIDELTTAVDEFVAAASDQVKPAADAFKESLDSLLNADTTATTAEGQLAPAQQVGQSWNALAAQVVNECPSPSSSS